MITLFKKIDHDFKNCKISMEINTSQRNFSSFNSSRQFLNFLIYKCIYIMSTTAMSVYLCWFCMVLFFFGNKNMFLFFFFILLTLSLLSCFSFSAHLLFLFEWMIGWISCLYRWVYGNVNLKFMFLLANTLLWWTLCVACKIVSCCRMVTILSYQLMMKSMIPKDV